MPAPQQDPEPLPHLRVDGDWAFDIPLEVELNGTVIARGNARTLYWTMPQQLAHATSNGASVRTGDLMASGTISGPERGSEGSLIELTRNGSEPVRLDDGAERTFLEDDDEVVLRGEPPARCAAASSRARELAFGVVCGAAPSRRAAHPLPPQRPRLAPAARRRP